MSAGNRLMIAKTLGAVCKVISPSKWEGVVGPMAMRRLAIGWWVIFVVIDLFIYQWGSPLWHSAPSVALWLKVLADLTSTIFIWGGCCAFLVAAASVIDRSRGRFFYRLIRHVLVVVGASLFFYLFFVWGFVARSGHLPNPETIVFLSENLTRLPQHVVQTSPLFAVSGVIVAIVASLLSFSSASVLARPLPIGSPARLFIASATSLAAWFFILPLGSLFSPVSLAVNSDEDIVLQAKAGVYLNGLAPITSGVSVRQPSLPFPVVVLLVESLRHDLLTETPQAVPFLKKLYDENIGFSRAYAVSSHSNLSDLAFWYGQYPLRGHGIEGFPVDAPWRGTSLFRAFKDAGYQTAYVSSQNEGWGNMVNWLKTPDIDYFFDSESYDGATWENYDDIAGLAGLIKRGVLNAGKIEDSETLRIATQWVDKQGKNKKFFLGMNLQNTHFSYIMPPRGAEPFQPADLGFRAVYYTWPAEKKENVRNRYLNAVSNVDRLIQEFSEQLKQRGLWDETLFVVVGDNGEAFHEHGFGNHSGPMYDEVVRTLAVVKLPASLQKMSRNIETPISHIDIAASIPNFLGLSVPLSFQGVPVIPDGQVPRPVFMYCNAIVRQYGIISGHWKLLINERPKPTVELFNLEKDPDELINLATENKGVVKALREQLLLWVKTQTTYYATELYATKAPPRYTERLLYDSDLSR